MCVRVLCIKGNRDLTVAQTLMDELDANAAKKVTKPLSTLLSALDVLPPHYRAFYQRKFVAELKRKIGL